MDAGNNPRTTRDALTIDLLGDVGRLDEKIKALPDILNKALEPTKTQLQKSQQMLSEQLERLPDVADREIKRAGDAAIDALSNQVAQIAQKIAGDAVVADRQKSFYIAAGALTAFAVVFFSAGMASNVVERAWGPFALSAMCIGIGVAAGMLLCQAMIAGEIKKKPALVVNTKPFTDPLPTAHFTLPWTTVDFERVAQNLSPKPNEATLRATRSVLLAGADKSRAAQIENVSPHAVAHAIAKFNAAR